MVSPLAAISIAPLRCESGLLVDPTSSLEDVSETAAPLPAATYQGPKYFGVTEIAID